jgi:ribosomal protein S18 acetylase RimI-like enzyme
MATDLRPGLGWNEGVVRTSIAAATRAAGDETELDNPDDVPDLSGWVMLQDGMAVAGAWSILHDGDCGIYTVGTLPQWRRRGLATALTQHILTDAYQRGARTATLQSTRMGQPLYETLGFEAVGRYEEWMLRTRDDDLD